MTRLLPALGVRHRVIVLHGSGRAVLEIVDGTRTVDDLIAALMPHPSPERVRDEVISFLHKLHSEGGVR
ncbi:PqqD family protein [Streptomyces sp. NPDC021056]|uniref:PqqD family protein n=1 Tax=Streptomyces sp. NPDC021056 TaxID=3155012 RepID=UPI0033FA6407